MAVGFDEAELEWSDVSIVMGLALWAEVPITRFCQSVQFGNTWCKLPLMGENLAT